MTVSRNIKITPKIFNEVDVIARTAANDLLERMDWLTLKPEVIAVLGWGRETLQKELSEKYPKAKVLTDIDPTQPVDMLCANLLLPWEEDHHAHFKAWQQALRAEGVLLISALGPDTLKECHAELNCHPVCVDMHDIGDALAAAGFNDPVMEVQQYTLDYSSKDKLWQELTTHDLWVDTTEKKALPEFTLTYELIYGHAFSADKLMQQTSAQGETVISLKDMKAALASL